MLDLPFLRMQCRQRHLQCSPPRKQNRNYLCQPHLCWPDHSSWRKRDPWASMLKLVFSLNCREFKRHYCITADSLNQANIPPKRICDPVDLWICLYGLATDVDRRKPRRWSPTGRHTWPPIISEEQMKNSSSYTRGILKLRFFWPFWSDAGLSCGLDSPGVTFCGCGVMIYQEPLDFLPTPSL